MERKEGKEGVMKTSLSDTDGIDTGCTAFWRKKVVWTLMFFTEMGWGFPGGTSGKEPTCQCRKFKRCEFNPWVRKIPGGGPGNPPQNSCLEKPHGQRSLVGYSPWGCKESDMTEST